MSQKQRGGVSQTNFHLFPVVIGVFCPSPDDPIRASGEEEYGSDPPFLTAGADRRWGGVYHRVSCPVSHPLRGRSRQIYPCGKAPTPGLAYG